MAGGATVHPDWTPVARRIREEATDDWDDPWRSSASRRRGAGWSGGGGAWRDPAGW